MAARVVLVSRRFKKDYAQFLRKYTDFEASLRDFLHFRSTARPDERYNSKDGPLTGMKCRHCHLVYGKAILIYLLHGSEIRLVAIEEHNGVEAGASASLNSYVKTLTPDDYYLFDTLNTVKPASSNATTTGSPMSDTDATTNPPADPTASTATPTPISNPLWADKRVHFALDQQLLYQPRPANPVFVFHLTRELIAPKGDVLVIDSVTHEIHHLTTNELNALFQPTSQVVTSLAEAMPHMAPAPIPTQIVPEAAPEPAPPIEAAAEPSADTPVQDAPEPVVDDPSVQEPELMKRTTARRHNVGPRLGRLLTVMVALKRRNSVSIIDTASISVNMPTVDRKGLSQLMVEAQNKGFIKKAGDKPQGPGYVYSMTPAGERTGKALDDWPFSVVGIPLPPILAQ